MLPRALSVVAPPRGVFALRLAVVFLLMFLFPECVLAVGWSNAGRKGGGRKRDHGSWSEDEVVRWESGGEGECGGGAAQR